jgi:cytochrome c553
VQVAAGAPLVQRGRIDGRLHPVKATPTDADHDLPGHRRLSCQACHSAWAPTCTTCHTAFDPRGTQWDFGRGAVADGAWIESSEAFEALEPALGVRAGRIVPVLPGMVMTIDAAAAGGGMPRDLRLYAALDPHSTRRESRTCASCHASSWAIGAGRGAVVRRDGAWRIAPDRPGGTSSGPSRDAWTGLFPDSPAPGTRTDVRSLDAAEQRRVLDVGPCLPCHTKAADPVYRDFPRSMSDRARAGTRCTFRENDAAQ